jgi:hypothetical protein
MKKLFILTTILLSVGITTISAQTKTASKLGTSSKLSKTDSLMCGKEWHITSVEELGVADKPGDKNKNDMLMITTDMKYTVILFGSKKSGTWSRAGQYIYFVDEASGEKFNYKVLAVEAKKIKLDYRDANEAHSVFEMESK